MSYRWTAILLLTTFAAAANAASTYQTTVLTTDTGVGGTVTDPNLVNAWGISFNPNGLAWVADNGTGLSTLYGSNSAPNSLVVTIPPPASMPTATATPTGVVFNSLGGFNVSSGGVSGSSAFIFATEDGTVSGWAPTVNLNNAILAVDQSAQNDVFKGLWTGTVASGPQAGNYLYVNDFRHGVVRTYNSSFQPVASGFSFTDNNLPAGYAPFGIRTIGSNVYVTYAMQDNTQHDEVDGAGIGLVDVYDTSGNFIRRLTTGGSLNAPWGLAQAPSNFGSFSNDLLVGNFGDGTISAFDPTTGTFQGDLESSPGNPLVIDGLWGLDFGNGLPGFPTNSLFFAAGPDSESHGAFGDITVLPEPASVLGLSICAAAIFARRPRRATRNPR